MARLSYSVLLPCLALLLVSTSFALSHTGNPNAPRHNGLAHLSEKRMIKVRQLLGPGRPNNGNTGTDTGTDDTGTNDPNNNPPAGQSSSSVVPTSTQVSTTSAAQSQTQNLQSASSSSASSSSPPAQSSIAPTSSAAPTSVAASSTAPTTSASLNLVATGSSSRPTTASATFSVATAQVTVDLPTSSAEAKTTSASTFSRNTIIAIVVIASCVGGAAGIWTLIRKWKLGPSAKFEERMAPIDWNPDMDTTAGAGIPGADREKGGYSEKHSRSGSHGSFHSSDLEHNNIGRNVTGNGNMFADQNPQPYNPETHDFTAGPVHQHGYDTAYAAAGPGYIDLQRSTSNGSQRSDNGTGLQRGPSVGQGAASAYPNAGAYEDAYGGAAYGHDAYGQDAYSGYNAYGQQQQYHQDQYHAQQDPYGQQQAQYRY